MGWEELSPDSSLRKSDSRDPAYNGCTYTRKCVHKHIGTYAHMSVCEACTHTRVHTEDEGIKSQGLKGSSAGYVAL